jgi:hypothetical protein
VSFVASFVVLAVAMLAMYATCRWGGRTLAGHYQDGWEVAAVAAMGACAFVALWAVKSVAAAGPVLPIMGLIAAAGGGLLAGYLRDEHA